MDNDKFQGLVEKAQGDPKFLHSLLFNPLEVAGDLGLERAEIGAVIASNPSELVARTIGIVDACGNTCTSSCDNTCGKSCGFTTNLTSQIAEVSNYFSRRLNEIAGCGNTCTSSCNNTCGQSCGFTTNLTEQFGFSGR